MEHEDQKRSGVLGFAAKVLDEAGGAVADAYDLGSTAVNKTSSSLKIKKTKSNGGKLMENKGQKGSGVLGFVAKVLNEAGGAVVDAYDLGSTTVRKTSSTLKKAPVLTEKAKGIITGGLEAIKPTKTKKVAFKEKEPIKEAETIEEYKIEEMEDKQPVEEAEVVEERKIKEREKKKPKQEAKVPKERKIKEKGKKETGKEAEVAKKQDNVEEDKTNDLTETPVKEKLVGEVESPEPEPVSAPVETTEPEIISPPLKVTFSKEKLKKMVKPQLLSLCKDLNIECDYTDTKDQIIEKILDLQISNH